MGVKIRRRKLSSGEVAFYIDVYHGELGRFSVKTGIQGNPKNLKAFIRQRIRPRINEGNLKRTFRQTFHCCLSGKKNQQVTLLNT